MEIEMKVNGKRLEDDRTVNDIIAYMNKSQKEFLYSVLEDVLETKTEPNTAYLERQFNNLKFSVPMRVVTRFLIEKAMEE